MSQRRYIISEGERVYRLNDGPLVLVGSQQDEVLQAVFERGLYNGGYRPGHKWWKPPKEGPTDVVLRTGQFGSLYAVNPNLSKVMATLKRGPLGAAITLPGKKRRGRYGLGYTVY